MPLPPSCTVALIARINVFGEGRNERDRGREEGSLQVTCHHIAVWHTCLTLLPQSAKLDPVVLSGGGDSRLGEVIRVG